MNSDTSTDRGSIISHSTNHDTEIGRGSVIRYLNTKKSTERGSMKCLSENDTTEEEEEQKERGKQNTVSFFLKIPMLVMAKMLSSNPCAFLNISTDIARSENQFQQRSFQHLSASVQALQSPNSYVLHSISPYILLDGELSPAGKHLTSLSQSAGR